MSNEQSTELQLIQARQNAQFAPTPVGQTIKQFETIQRIAQMYEKSTIVPEIYKGNVGNCAIAIDMAMRMGANPLMIMQNLYIVKGNPSWSSKFLIATINTSGKYTSLMYKKRNLGKVGKIQYNDTVYDPTLKKNTITIKNFDGSNVDNIECIAYSTAIATGDVLESDPITVEIAIREGWYTKSGSKWVTMPNLMLTYRAAAFWQRSYCPEISMGFLTKEEIEDVEYVDVTRAPNSANADNVNNAAAEFMQEEGVQNEASTEIKPETKPQGKSLL